MFIIIFLLDIHLLNVINIKYFTFYLHTSVRLKHTRVSKFLLILNAFIVSILVCLCLLSYLSLFWFFFCI